MRQTFKLAFGCEFFCFGKKNNLKKYLVLFCNKVILSSEVHFAPHDAQRNVVWR